MKKKVFISLYFIIVTYLFIAETIFNLGLDLVAFIVCALAMFFIPKKINTTKLYLLMIFPLLLWFIGDIIGKTYLNSIGGILFVKLIQSIYLFIIDNKTPIWLKVVRILIVALLIIPAFMFSASPSPQGQELIVYSFIAVCLILVEFGLTFIHKLHK